MKKASVCVVPSGETPVSFKGYRFPPDIVSYAVWLYYRFPCIRSRNPSEPWRSAMADELDVDDTSQQRVGDTPVSLGVAASDRRRFLVQPHDSPDALT